MKQLRATIIACGFVLASCGGGREARDAVPLPTDAETARLKERMDRIGDVLIAQGFEPTGIERIADVSPEQGAEIPLPLKSRRRVVVVAIGQEKRVPFDLDLEVTTVQKRVAAQDRSANFRAAVVFQARSQERYGAILRAKRGSGRCLVSVFESRAESASVELARLFDADPLFRRSFGDATLHASAMGFRALELPDRMPVRLGELIAFSMEQKKGRCYMLGATGTAGVDILETRLFVSGRLTTADFQGRPEVWVRNCAEKDQQVNAQIKVLAGTGIVTLGWFDAARADVYEIVGPPIHVIDDPPGIDALTALVTQKMTAKGYVAIRSLLESHIAAGDQSLVPLWVGAGECVIARGVVDEGVRDLDLEIRLDNEVVASNRGNGFRPRVSICAREDTAFELAVIAMSGEGAVRVLVGALPEVSLPEIPHPDLIFPAREAAALLQLSSLSPKNEIVQLDRLEEAVYRADIELEAHCCYGVLVLSAAGLSNAKVQRPDGEAVVVWKGQGSAGLMTLCPSETGEYLLTAGTEEGVEPSEPAYCLLFESTPL